MVELTRLESAKRHRYVVFVDKGVASAIPGLCADIADYADAWPDVLQLVAEPEVIAGGEEIKNDPALVARASGTRLCSDTRGLTRPGLPAPAHRRAD